MGAAGVLRYYRLERVERRKTPPQGGQPFDIGDGLIVLHNTTVPAVLSHWVEYGHGIEELHAFKRLAPDNHLLLDIGAAEGIYAAAFCSLTGQTSWAFEPSPEMFARLEHLCRVNPNLAIHPSNIAMDASAGERAVRLYPDGQFSGVGSTDDTLVMTTTTVDAFVNEHRLEPDMAKIDVEGMELDVLRGGERTFRGTVRTILLEVHYALLEQHGQTMDELQGVLQDYGFRLESLDDAEIADLSDFAQSRTELQPDYTIIVCRKPRAGGS